jgi:hypothetical protein
MLPYAICVLAVIVLMLVLSLVGVLLEGLNLTKDAERNLYRKNYGKTQVVIDGDLHFNISEALLYTRIFHAIVGFVILLFAPLLSNFTPQAETVGGRLLLYMILGAFFHRPIVNMIGSYMAKKMGFETQP